MAFLAFTGTVGCKSNNNEKIEILREGSYTVKVGIVDGKRNGIMKMYDSTGKLVETINYKDGIEMGTCIHYSSYGTVKDSVEYLCGKPHGYLREYNENGSVRHIGYYFFGLQFGPDLLYGDSTILRDFEFLNFERQPIVKVSYNERGHIDSIRKFDLSVQLGQYLAHNNAKVAFFAYLPKIPLADQSYSIGWVDKKKIAKKLCDVKGSNFFIDTILMPPPSGYHYFLECDLKSAKYNDTIRVDAK